MKREKTLVQRSVRKKTQKSWTLFYDRLFYNVFKMTINHFFLNRFTRSFFISQAHSQHNFYFLISGWRKQYKKGIMGTANS